MNNVNLIGRLTRDPEMLYTQQGLGITEFGLAVDRRTKDDDADFFDVVSFGKLAESVGNNLGKGRLVGVSGRLQQDRWTNSEGQNRSKVKVIASQVDFLDWPKDDAPF